MNGKFEFYVESLTDSGSPLVSSSTSFARMIHDAREISHGGSRPVFLRISHEIMGEYYEEHHMIINSDGRLVWEVTNS